MNNINLYLDNLVDQDYDITLMKYWIESGCLIDYNRFNEFAAIGYGCKTRFGNGIGYINGDGTPTHIFSINQDDYDPYDDFFLKIESMIYDEFFSKIESMI